MSSILQTNVLDPVILFHIDIDFFSIHLFIYRYFFLLQNFFLSYSFGKCPITSSEKWQRNVDDGLKNALKNPKNNNNHNNNKNNHNNKRNQVLQPKQIKQGRIRNDRDNLWKVPRYFLNLTADFSSFIRSVFVVCYCCCFPLRFYFFSQLLLLPSSFWFFFLL